MDILNFLPTAAEHCTIMELLDEMELFEVATKRLQSNDLTIIGARDIFDEVLADFPTLQDRLYGDADIVESVDFERAVVKIMNGEEVKLTSAEGEAATRLRRFPITPAAPSVSNAKAKRGQASKAKGARKKRPASNEASEPASKKPKRTAADLKAALVDRAKAREENKSAYEDLNWLPATSVVVERLFSTIKCTLGYLRKRMSAETLESILYLRMNWDLMTNEVLSGAIKNAREAASDADEESDSFA